MSSTATELSYGKIEETLGRRFDPVLYFIQRIPYLVERARTMGRESAYSYRDFHVAGAIVAHSEAEKIIWEDVGGNLKRATKAKVCMERKLDGRAEKRGMLETIGYVVLGTTDKKAISEVSDLATPTLHWCTDCRHDIPNTPRTTPNTIIFTSGLEDDVNQSFLTYQLTDMYRRAESGDIDRALMRSQPSLDDWEMRVATYQAMTSGWESAAIPLHERQRLAQLALSGTITI